DDMVTAQMRDEFCQPAGGYGRGLFAQVRLPPVHDSIDLGSVFVDNAAAHAVDGVFANNLIRCGQADVGQLGSFPAQGVQRDFKAGQDYAADVIARLVYHRHGGGGAHVVDNDG